MSDSSPTIDVTPAPSDDVASQPQDDVTPQPAEIVMTLPADNREEISRLKHQKGGFLSHLSRLYKEADQLMFDKGTVADVTSFVEKVRAQFAKLEQSHLTLTQLLGDSERESVEQTFELYRNNFDEFLFRTTEYLRDMALSRAPSEAQSAVSTTSSVRAKAASIARKREQLKLDQMVADRELRQMEEKLAAQQRDLQLRREILQQQTEVEQAKAAERTWLQTDVTEMATPDVTTETEAAQVRTSRTAFPDTETAQERISRTTHNQETGLAWTQAPRTYDRAAGPQLMYTDTGLAVQAPRTDTTTTTTELTGLANFLQNYLTLPPPELFSFSGEAIDYNKFIQNFEANIEQKVSDNRQRLNYLIKYTKGEPRELIEACVMLGEMGYYRAKELLRDRYGKSHVVAQAHVNALINGPPIKANDTKALLRLSLDLCRASMTLSSLGFSSQIDNTETIRVISNRLPHHIRSKWTEHAYRIQTGVHSRCVLFSDLCKFVEERANVESSMFAQDLSFYHSSRTHEPRSRFSKSFVQQRASGVKSAVSLATSGASASSQQLPAASPQASVNQLAASPGVHTEQASFKIYPCRCCGGSCRRLWECTQFRQLSWRDRKDCVRKHKLCDNCFIYKHRAAECRKESYCRVTGCGQKHHTLLHPPSPAVSAEPAAPQQAKPAAAANVNSVHGDGRVLLKIVPVQVCSGGQTVKTYALLDGGSTVSLIENSLVEKLNVTGINKQFVINTVNGTSEINSKEVPITVTSLDGNNNVKIPNAWAVPKLSISPDSIPKAGDTSKWQHLQGIDLPEIDVKQISLLIGSDTPEVFWSLEERRGARGEPQATRTLLGWTLQGPTTGCKPPQASVNCIMVEQLKAMWAHEFNDSSSTAKTMSQEDKKALKMLNESKSLENSHYKFCLPWKDDTSCLPYNRSMAEHRLKLLQRKFDRDATYAERYTAQVQDYITKGYASPANPSHMQQGREWFIPHHGVVNPKKPGKVRVVFDAAARFRGVSLNDSLLQGPDLVNSLVGVLIRFRQHPVAIISDIEAMFHQVVVKETDRGALRFLWFRNGDPNQGIESYQMNRFIFGAKPSPCAAALALQSVANDFKSQFSPEVDRKSTRLNSSHSTRSRMPSSA